MHPPCSDPYRHRYFRPAMRQLLIAGWVGLLWPINAGAWSLVVEQGKVGMALPDIRAGGWEVTGSVANVLPSITASVKSAVVEFSPPSLVLTDRLAYTGAEQALVLRDLRTDLSDVTLTLDYGAGGDWSEWVAVQGKVKIDATRIEHPLLVPQAWSFQGSVNGRLADLRIQGVLVSGSGAKADLDIQLDAGAAVSISIDSTINGPKGVRALAEAITVWPKLLTVDQGSAEVSAQLRLRPEDGLRLEGHLRLNGVSGVFNRTAFAGITGGLLASLEGDRMTAGLRELTVDQVNPGIAVNRVRLAADYTASVAEPGKGRLEVQEATARLLEGALRIPQGTYRLEHGLGQLPVEVKNLSLARLMEVYPAEGLEGSGLLSGRIPISLGDNGIQVAQGRLSAEAPGGRLQLPADRLQGMLGSNQATDLVVQALQNFHYSVLSSTVDYDETGKLTLGLRLEGKNPELRGGQPVILNVNLEDDIPALLTSLQLSGRVNEAVTERVRKLLQQPGQEVEP